MAIGNKLVRKQRVVDSLFKRKKKSLGEAKKKYVSLSNYLERAKTRHGPGITFWLFVSLQITWP